MPTDEERREVAQKLRNICPDRFNSILYGVHLSSVGIASCAQIVSAHHDLVMRAASRLADLIEPEPEQTCHNFGGQEGTNGEYYDFACSACGFMCDLPDVIYCPHCRAKVIDSAD